MSEEKRYSAGEEIANSLTHGIGVLLGVYAVVSLSMHAVSDKAVTASVIYAVSAILLFGASTLYHAVTRPDWKLLCRKIDHSAIYVLIAGTYTPILLIGTAYPMSVVYLCVVWAVAVAGTIFSCISLKNKLLGTVIYLLSGWMGVFLLHQLWKCAPHAVSYYLIGGGIVYSAGSVFYMMKKPYMHAVWHLFVLGGCILHYFSVLTLAGSRISL